MSAVWLTQPVSTTSRSQAHFSLSFVTSSLSVLDEVIQAGGPRSRIRALTLALGQPSADGPLGATTWQETFPNGVVDLVRRESFRLANRQGNAVGSIGPLFPSHSSSRSFDLGRS